MRTIRLTGPRVIEVIEIADRPLEASELRVKTFVTGISHGTELSTYNGTAPVHEKQWDPQLRTFVPRVETTPYPLSLGYEAVGEVTEVGDDVEGVSVGDMVHTGTPHQDVAIVRPDDRVDFYPLVRLPAHPTHEPGLFVSLAAVALQGIHDAQIKVGDTVAVHGAGTIGLMTTQLAKLNGAGKVIVVEPDVGRRVIAKEVGADIVLDPFESSEPMGFRIIDALGGISPDVSIETSGSYHALNAALASAGLTGRVVAVGFYQGGGGALRLGEEWHRNRVTMISSMGVWGSPHRSSPFWDRKRMMETVVDLLYSGRLRTDFAPIEYVGLDDAADVYRKLSESAADTVKVAFRFAGRDGV